MKNILAGAAVLDVREPLHRQRLALGRGRRLRAADHRATRPAGLVVGVSGVLLEVIVGSAVVNGVGKLF